MGSLGEASNPVVPRRGVAAAHRYRVLWAFFGLAGTILLLTLIAHFWIERRARERGWDQAELIERSVSRPGTLLIDPALPEGVLVVDLVPAGGDGGFALAQPATIRAGTHSFSWSSDLRVRFNGLVPNHRYPITVLGPYAAEPTSVTLPRGGRGARIAVRVIPLDPLRMPGFDTAPLVTPEKKLEVDMTREDAFRLRWIQGTTVVSMLDLPRGAPQRSPDGPFYPALAAKVTNEWKMQGGHRDPSDRRLDQAIVRATPGAPFEELFAVVSSIFATQREMKLPDGGRRNVYAFDVSVEPPLPPREPPRESIELTGIEDGSAARSRPSLIVRPGALVASGRLAPDVIQRILRRRFGDVRRCYERGLDKNPALRGRVAVRFVIGADGAVSRVTDGGSDMPDAEVIQCIVRVVEGLSFPQPERGIVTVVSPFLLSPGG